MLKIIKNKFIKYIYITSAINLISTGGMITSCYFFATQYSDYFLQTNNDFWVGYILIVLMICTISVFVVSFSIIWKLIYDYLWRKKQDKKEGNNA